MHCPNPPYPSSFFFSLSSSSDYFPDARSCCQKLGGHSLSRKCVPPSPNCAKLLEAGHCRVALPPLTGRSLNRITQGGVESDSGFVRAFWHFYAFKRGARRVAQIPCPAILVLPSHWRRRPQAETMDGHSSPRFLGCSGCV